MPRFVTTCGIRCLRRGTSFSGEPIFLNSSSNVKSGNTVAIASTGRWITTDHGSSPQRKPYYIQNLLSTTTSLFRTPKRRGNRAIPAW